MMTILSETDYDFFFLNVYHAQMYGTIYIFVDCSEDIQFGLADFDYIFLRHNTISSVVCMVLKFLCEITRIPL